LGWKGGRNAVYRWGGRVRETAVYHFGGRVGETAVYRWGGRVRETAGSRKMIKEKVK
jgi:uncharacterized protein involved in tolerance to divalent cations